MVPRLLLLGATGDLALRYLFPSLGQLVEAELLPRGFSVVGVDRAEVAPDAFVARVRDALGRHAAGLSSGAADRLLGALTHRAADVTRGDELERAADLAQGPAVVYLALPPALFEPVVRALAASRPAPGTRLVIEKPFGEDLASAQRLNAVLREHFAEAVVHRVDHFLGLQTVQNVLGVRFANRIFEPLWNARHIERVSIVWDEQLTVEGRAGYYDRAGALRDMVQNHLLQLLCLVAMEPPTSLHERDLRDRKLDVLRAVRSLGSEDVERHTTRARYTAGRIDGRQVPDYVAVPGVDPGCETETFATATLFVDNWRWAGVPFQLRTGKALGAEHHEIAVHFRAVPHLTFGAHTDPDPNVLRLTFDPDRLELYTAINGPGDPFDLETVELATTLPPQAVSAYARVLLDAFNGDPTLSIRGDEAEESWRIVEPILAAWGTGRPALREYRAGSSGPEA